MGRIGRLLHQGIRVVVADRRVKGMPVVEANNRGGSRELTRYVLRLGYKRIAYISGPQEVSTARDRLRGFQEAMTEAQMTPVIIHHGDFTYESGYENAREVLNKHDVDAIMAGNDLIAIGVIQAAEDNGLEVPKDLGVTGFDNTPLLALARPKLTTVKVQAYRFGEEVARQLFEQEVENLTLPVRLISGGTCQQQK
jgi:DNA-binding LacI/PurR family transcriptional regulator